jgi:hypothetical protein
MERLTEEDHNRLLWLCRNGMLFEVQDWLDEGRSTLRPQEKRTSALISAAAQGFHSLVRVLLERGEFESSEMASALWEACHRGFYETAKLLVLHGAPANKIEFCDLCSHGVDREFLAFMLDHGADPSLNDGFAWELVTRKTKPLLGLFFEYRERLPALEIQASRALRECVEKNTERGIALLVWARVNPLLKVSDNPYMDALEENEDFSESAAQAAIRTGNLKALRALKIRPSQDQLRELLDDTTWRCEPKILRLLLRFAADPGILNDRPDGTCSILTGAIEAFPDSWSNLLGRQGDRKRLLFIRVLTRHGAKWGPDPNYGLNGLRRRLYENNSSFVVSLTRFMWEHPDNFPRELLDELVSKPKYKEWIKEGDRSLAVELFGREPKKRRRKAAKPKRRVIRNRIY